MRVLVVGASGHVGRVAVAALAEGNDIVAVSRSTEPSVDVTDPSSIERLFEVLGPFDAIVSAIGSVPFLPLDQLSREDYLSAFRGKVLSQLDLVRIGEPHMRDGGSFTLTSGILSRVAIATGSAAAMANGALESFVLAAARELPRGIRINVVSPSVLEDAPAYHDAFPGFIPVTSRAVGAAFVRSVRGVETGVTFAVD
ncbi:short chain dehydrogenase [Microbacterium sp.]|uniref:short chain dehydrogenase n=1 Tax=Microbacterium sp. TaxID=51671 RepID=UPI003C77FF57